MSKSHHSSEVDKKSGQLATFLSNEIAEQEDNARLAYVLGVRQTAGDVLTPEELEFIEQQKIEKLVVARLKDIFSKVKSFIPKKEPIRERELFAVLRFFYLVRLAQQGFLHFISGAYPSVEPDAIAYLADKLVAGSMGKEPSDGHFDASRELAKKISKDLYFETNNPVADGFTTTFKDIMTLANQLGSQGLYQQGQVNQPSERNHQSEENQPSEEPSEGNQPSAENQPPELIQQTEHKKQSQGTQAPAVPTAVHPPIWIVVPYTSMMDKSTFTVPHLNPASPIPGLFISNDTTTNECNNTSLSASNESVSHPTFTISKDCIALRAAERDRTSRIKKSKKKRSGRARRERIALREERARIAKREELARAVVAENSDISTSATNELDNKPEMKGQGCNATAREISGQGSTATTQEMHGRDSAANTRGIEESRRDSDEDVNDDDRFADADPSDDYTDEEEDTEETPKAEVVSTTTEDTQKAPNSPSHWQSFAASSCNDSVAASPSSLRPSRGSPRRRNRW